MTKISIVYQQHYEEVYIFGVFSSQEKLDDALDTLQVLPEIIEQAERRQADAVLWWKYNSQTAKYKPWALDKTIPEIARHLLNVHVIKLDEVNINPNWLGYEDAKDGG